MAGVSSQMSCHSGTAMRGFAGIVGGDQRLNPEPGQAGEFWSLICGEWAWRGEIRCVLEEGP